MGSKRTLPTRPTPTVKAAVEAPVSSFQDSSGQLAAKQAAVRGAKGAPTTQRAAPAQVTQGPVAAREQAMQGKSRRQLRR